MLNHRLYLLAAATIAATPDTKLAKQALGDGWLGTPQPKPPAAPKPAAPAGIPAGGPLGHAPSRSSIITGTQPTPVPQLPAYKPPGAAPAYAGGLPLPLGAGYAGGAPATPPVAASIRPAQPPVPPATAARLQQRAPETYPGAVARHVVGGVGDTAAGAVGFLGSVPAQAAHHGINLLTGGDQRATAAMYAKLRSNALQQFQAGAADLGSAAQAQPGQPSAGEQVWQQLTAEIPETMWRPSPQLRQDGLNIGLAGLTAGGLGAPAWARIAGPAWARTAGPALAKLLAPAARAGSSVAPLVNRALSGNYFGLPVNAGLGATAIVGTANLVANRQLSRYGINPADQASNLVETAKQQLGERISMPASPAPASAPAPAATPEPAPEQSLASVADAPRAADMVDASDDDVYQAPGPNIPDKPLPQLPSASKSVAEEPFPEPFDAPAPAVGKSVAEEPFGAAPQAAPAATTAAAPTSEPPQEWSAPLEAQMATALQNKNPQAAVDAAAQGVQAAVQDPAKVETAVSAATDPTHPAATGLIGQLTGMFGGDGQKAQAAWDNMGTGAKFLLGLGAGFGLVSLLQQLLGDDDDSMMSWLLPIVGGGAAGLLATGGKLPDALSGLGGLVGQSQPETATSGAPPAASAAATPTAALSPERRQMLDAVRKTPEFGTLRTAHGAAGYVPFAGENLQRSSVQYAIPSVQAAVQQRLGIQLSAADAERLLQDALRQ